MPETEFRVGLFGLPTNARLEAIAAPWTEDAATRRALRDRDCVRRVYQTTCAARGWRAERRPVARVEARRDPDARGGSRPASSSPTSPAAGRCISAKTLLRPRTN